MKSPSFDRGAFFRSAAAVFRASLAEGRALSPQQRADWLTSLQEACDSCNATLSDPERRAAYSPAEIEQLQAVEAAMEALLERLSATQPKGGQV